MRHIFEIIGTCISIGGFTAFLILALYNEYRSRVIRRRLLNSPEIGGVLSVTNTMILDLRYRLLQECFLSQIRFCNKNDCISYVRYNHISHTLGLL